jgi:hypothetical protein
MISNELPAVSLVPYGKYTNHVSLDISRLRLNAAPDVATMVEL